VTSLSLSDTDPAELAVDAIVVGLHMSGDAIAGADTGGPLLAPGAESVAVAFEGQLAQTLAMLGATGAVGEVTKIATLGTISAPVVAAVGLGAAPDDGAYSAETLRRAAGAAVRSLAGMKSVTLALPGQDLGDAAPLLRAVAEGALLGGYRFAGYKTKAQPQRRGPVTAVGLHVPDATDRIAKAETKRAQAVAAAVARTRDWVNTAPNDLRPPAFAAAVVAAAEAAGLPVEVLDEKALKKGGYGGILAVGMGSDAPPRLVRLAYTPRNPKARVALVGKGITFDTGGYAVKPPQGMWEMKSDMAGAAAVASAVMAAAALKLKVAVVGYLPIAENMISASAYRPGDVITMYGGRRVEVLNTDAEGRMVLADAIVRAQEDEPDYLIETSTLTGGQVVALGKRIAGVMGDPALCERIRLAGDTVGEPTWPMPIPDEIRKNMDSDVADISQVSQGMDRSGHMLQGAAFLREFVQPGLPWAHIDVAGPAYNSGEASGYLPKGGTGVPVRLLVDLLENIAVEG
jgi:leucyl aminopeptidase